MSDLIRREDAIMAIADSVQGCIPDTETMEKSIYTARLILSDVPSVEPKHGEWIDNGDCEYLCSECGMSSLFAPYYNFCPDCGADMRKTEK